MPLFSSKSKVLLLTCHPQLEKLFNTVIQHFDCTILEGHRSKGRQKQLYKEGKSKLTHSKHNHNPSLAVDVSPYPIDWNDIKRFYYFAGFVKGVATSLNIPLRWGGDWDSDTQVADNTFNDLVHFELKENH